MGRPRRIKAPGVTYHVTSRTNGKRLCIKKGRDKKALCRCLLRIQVKYKAKIYGFTPMENHFHLLVKMDEEADLSKFMCEFKTAYAKYFNTKYNMSGHFWGDRFHSTLVEDDKYMLACLRYIDRNPVRAGLVEKPNQWLYSSFHYYAYGKQHEILIIELHPTYLNLANDPIKRRELYVDYVTGEDVISDGLHGTMERRMFLGSHTFVNSFQ